MFSAVRAFALVAFGTALASGCKRLSDQERCALDGQFAAGADITSTGRTIHCVPATNDQDRCNVEVEAKFARRGHVLGAWRFFESEIEKAEADLESLAGIADCIAKYPCTGDSCSH